jgi:hypothetical protein
MAEGFDDKLAAPAAGRQNHPALSVNLHSAVHRGD